ncbi:MAG: glycoside hydrolase family 9 protein [Chlamydiia bacterium]|nr:glycoside hydrolase family 9 protein [Chlamydiia bacterium]
MDDSSVHYAYGLRTRYNTLLYAACAAQYALLVEPFDKDLAKKYSVSALRAYAFGTDSKHDLGTASLHAKSERGRGMDYVQPFQDMDQTSLGVYETHARLRLFLLTDDPSYLDTVQDLLIHSPRPFQHPLEAKMLVPWLHFSLMHPKIAQHIPKGVIEEWRSLFVGHAADIAKHSWGQPYRASWPVNQDYWMAWGASSFYNQAKFLLIAHTLSGMDGFKDTALKNCDFMLGCNPMGMSWTTGVGTCYPVDIQHGPSETDGIADPVPGITIYGYTGGVARDLTSLIWTSPDAKLGTLTFMPKANTYLPVWNRWSCHPSSNAGQCEFTIHETVSASIFATAMLLPDGWMPSEELKNSQPKDEKDLFGYWYLP